MDWYKEDEEGREGSLERVNVVVFSFCTLLFLQILLFGPSVWFRSTKWSEGLHMLARGISFALFHLVEETKIGNAHYTSLVVAHIISFLVELAGAVFIQL